MKLFILAILLAIVFELPTALGCKDVRRKFNVKIGRRTLQKNCFWVKRKIAGKGNRCMMKTPSGKRLRDLCRTSCKKCKRKTKQPTSPPTAQQGPTGSNPTNPPVRPPTNPPVRPPTRPPVNPPTRPPVNPTRPPAPSPTNAPISNGNGCCSLDYKNCVNWCNESYDACMNCGDQRVVWLPNGRGPNTCGERWKGCGQNNDDGHSGCCDGLTCKWRTGENYFACLPGDSNPNPIPNPTRQPVSNPVSNPTRPPQSPVQQPVQPPVQPPTGGGGGGGGTGDWRSGKATMYGGNPSGGACGYNDLPQVTFPRGFSVAIGADEFDNGYGCGACYEVECVGPQGNNPNCFCGSGSQKKVIVQATDQCPECSTTHFDLNADAFASIVQGQSMGMAGTCGIIKTNFRRVSCDFKSNIKIRSKGGTSGYWYGLHVDDVAGYGAIKSVKLREAGRRNNGQTAFDIDCRKSEGASFWLCNRPNNRQIFANLDVQLTDSAGRKLSSNNVITNLGGGQEFDFKKNYGPIPGDSPTPTTPVSPTAAPVVPPTRAPAPTVPFSGELLSTDKAMNAWEVYKGLAAVTYKNSENPPKYAYVSS